VDATIETLLDSSLKRFYLGLVFQLGLSQLTDGRPDHLAGIVIVAALNTLLNIAVEFIGQTYIPGRHGFLLRALSYSSMATFAIEKNYPHKVKTLYYTWDP
jgi:hypothetical protein